MGDIGDMPEEYIQKKKQFEIDDINLKTKGYELRIMELKQQIKQIEFDIEMNNSRIAELQGDSNKPEGGSK